MAKVDTWNPGSFTDIASQALSGPVWQFLNEHDNVVRMESATELVSPAVAILGSRLLAKFGKTITQQRWKQAMGHMTRQIMERNGWQIDRSDVKVAGNPVFTTATRYKK